MSGRRSVREALASITAGPWLAAIAVSGITIFAFVTRYRLLASSPYPLGVDGHYYAVQLRALLADGTLQYPAAPLTFYLMAPLAAIWGPLEGARLGAALLGALGCVTCHGLGSRLGGSRIAGLLAAVLVATSAESIYLSTEFVKTSVGLTLAAGALWALSWTLAAPSLRRWIVSVLALCAVAATHKLALALTVGVGLCGIWAWGRDRQRVPWRRGIVVAAAAIAALAVAGVLAPARFPALRDLRLLGDLLGPWRWPPPVLDAGVALYFDHETLWAGGVGALLLAAFAASRHWPDLLVSPAAGPDRALSAALALLSIAIAAPVLDVGDAQGLGFRLRLLGFFGLALCAAALVGLQLRWRTSGGRGWIVALCALLLMVRAGASREGMVEAHPAMIAAVRASASALPADAVVIVPERHILFMVAWYTDRPARLRPEPVPPARRWRMLPLHAQRQALRTAIDRARTGAPAPPIGLHPDHRNGLVVMPEATWVWILDRLPAEDREHYRRWVTI